MNKNQCGKLVAVLSGLIFVCSASAMDQAQSATTGAEHTSNDAPHAAQRAAQMKSDPLPADDFAGLNYTSGQKAEIDKIHQETESHKAVVARDETLTADQKNSMILGYTRMEYGLIYKVLLPEQQKQVRQKIIARRAADRADQQKQPRQ